MTFRRNSLPYQTILTSFYNIFRHNSLHMRVCFQRHCFSLLAATVATTAEHSLLFSISLLKWKFKNIHEIIPSTSNDNNNNNVREDSVLVRAQHTCPARSATQFGHNGPYKIMCFYVFIWYIYV